MAGQWILEQQTLSGFWDTEEGFWMWQEYFDIPAFENGKDYRVIWDGKGYNCKAFTVGTYEAVGNANLYFPDMPSTGEPFALAVSVDGSVQLTCLTIENGDAHTVAIYKKPEIKKTADIKVKGYSGAELYYDDVPIVYMAAPESTEDNPVLVPFTYGEAVEDVEIDPDFSSGETIVSMPEGMLARSAVVKKPENLIPGNIRKGASVAGIVGDYVPETEEITVEANFSEGDMIVEPSEEKNVDRVIVKKPESLIPGNVAEGVEIAGIVGTLSGSTGGAGSRFECTVNEDGEITEAALIGFTSIPTGCFANMEYLTAVDLTQSPELSAIQAKAFYGCKALKKVSIPSTVTSIGDRAFAECTAMTSLYIPESVTSIGAYIAENSGTNMRVNMYCNIDDLPADTLKNCTGAIRIEINGSKSIPGYAFSGCTSLSTVSLQRKVDYVYPYAFDGCANLASVEIISGSSAWKVSKTKFDTNGTMIDVSSFSTNAKNFKGTYKTYYWVDYYDVG